MMISMSQDLHRQGLVGPETLRIQWMSPLPVELLDAAFGVGRYTAVERPGADRSYDLRVLDARAFETSSALREMYHADPTPALIIVSLAFENEVLAWLGLGDEVCPEETASVQVPLRLRRMIALWKTQHEQALGRRDFLTGLVGPQTLNARLSQLTESVSIDHPFSVILLNIDHFQTYNYRFGHSAGDHLLKELAQLLRRHVSAGNLLVHIGCDQFALILSDTDEPRARTVAEMLRARIEAHRFSRNRQITVSIGMVAILAPVPPEEALSRAETMLYAAKRAGRNQVITETEFQISVDENEDSWEIRDFENRIRVNAARLADAFTLRGRQIIRRYRDEADRDGLTGLYNRRYLERRLAREVGNASKTDRPFSVGFLDLDHFGVVNREYGHPAGDRALQTLATVLRRAIRATDWAARYGGEEFLVAMPDTPLSEAHRVAERITENLRTQAIEAYDGRIFGITASIGLVQYSPQDSDPVALVQRASDRMRQAKIEGRNRVCS